MDDKFYITVAGGLKKTTSSRLFLPTSQGVIHSKSSRFAADGGLPRARVFPKDYSTFLLSKMTPVICKLEIYKATKGRGGGSIKLCSRAYVSLTEEGLWIISRLEL